MEVTIGEEGLTKSWQNEFPKETECVWCEGVARIGFVAHEGIPESDPKEPVVFKLHENKGKGGYWLHDLCAVAVYFCKECLKTTAFKNQA